MTDSQTDKRLAIVASSLLHADDKPSPQALH